VDHWTQPRVTDWKASFSYFTIDIERSEKSVWISSLNFGFIAESSAIKTTRVIFSMDTLRRSVSQWLPCAPLYLAGL